MGEPGVKPAAAPSRATVHDRQERFRALFEAAGEGMAIIEDGRFVEDDAAILAILGTTR